MNGENGGKDWVEFITTLHTTLYFDVSRHVRRRISSLENTVIARARLPRMQWVSISLPSWSFSIKKKSTEPCEIFACISICLSVVFVCRRTPGSHSHDEHLDSAERYSSCHCDQEGVSFAAQTGQVLEDSDAFRSALVLISRGVSIHVHATVPTNYFASNVFLRIFGLDYFFIFTPKHFLSCIVSCGTSL